jgi:deazaflavin-dependent oxidoreductase (nitroreductase family)
MTANNNLQSIQVGDASMPRFRPGSNNVFNRLVLKIAGTRLLPIYGVIEHRGRRSGKLYRTPVVVRPARDGFIVPMPWGEHTDWYRNVKAAGECIIRWKGRDYKMIQPELIAPARARASFGGITRAVVARFKINHFLHLRLRT